LVVNEVEDVLAHDSPLVHLAGLQLASVDSPARIGGATELVRSNFPLASQSAPHTWRSRQLLLGFLHLTNALGDETAALLLVPELGSLAARLRDRNLETFANQHSTPDERHLEIILKVFTSFGVVVVEQCL